MLSSLMNFSVYDSRALQLPAEWIRPGTSSSVIAWYSGCQNASPRPGGVGPAPSVGSGLIRQPTKPSSLDAAAQLGNGAHGPAARPCTAAGRRRRGSGRETSATKRAIRSLQWRDHSSVTRARLDRMHLQVGARRDELHVGADAVHAAHQLLGHLAHRGVGDLRRGGRVGAAADEFRHVAEALGRHDDVGVGVDDHVQPLVEVVGA